MNEIQDLNGEDEEEGKVIKRKKNSGFTLIEMIAVIAIIGILAAVILPKVSGYIDEAKKVKVVDQSRKVVMAVESYNLKNDPDIEDAASVAAIKEKAQVKNYLGEVNTGDDVTPNLDTSMSLKQCQEVIDGADFSIDSDTNQVKTASITPKDKTENIEKKQ